MKKFFLPLIAVALFSLKSMATPPEVSEKVLKVFTDSYSDASEVKWFENATTFEARFRQNNIRVVAQYDFDGNLVSTLRYYEGDQLHPFIMGKLRKKFGDKRIHGVTEKVNDQDVEYSIVLEDEKNWITVKSNALGDLTVTEKLKKANP